MDTDMINRISTSGKNPYFQSLKVSSKGCSPRQDECLVRFVQEDLNTTPGIFVIRTSGNQDYTEYVIRVRPTSDKPCHIGVALAREEIIHTDLLRETKPIYPGETQITVNSDIKREKAKLVQQEIEKERKEAEDEAENRKLEAEKREADICAREKAMGPNVTILRFKHRKHE